MAFISPRDLVRRGAERHPHRVAVITAEERLTYGQLADKTAAQAAALKKAGIGAGVQVGLMFPNSIAYLVWHFGILEAGGISASLPPTMTAAEARNMLDGGGFRYVAAPQDHDLPRELGMSPVPEAETAEGACLWRSPHPYPAIETTPWTTDGIMVRLFSSGSTGRPKHMLKTEANIFQHFWQSCDAFHLDQDECFLAVTPFSHAYSSINYNAAFYLGGSVTLVPRFLPASVLETARRDRPTIFTVTPPMIEVLGTCLLNEGDDTAFQDLKYCICGTVRMAQDVHDRFEKRFGVPVTFQYGSTESMTATVDLDEGYEEGRVGRPFSGVTIGIFGDDGEPMPACETGLIGISSPGASTEYVNDPESSARTFRNGYVFPGDTGFLDETGNLHVLGRSDIINIGGYKVDRLEVERVIRDSLTVRDVVVLEGERAGLPVIRAVVEADPATITPATVIAACREQLSPHKVPAMVDVREKLARDANGKILMRDLDS